MNNYVIFTVDDTSCNACKGNDTSPKKTVLKKFQANNDAEAYEKLQEYKKATGNEACYYANEHAYVILDKDGNKKNYASMDDAHNEWYESLGIWDKLSMEFSYMWSRVKDAWYWLKYLWYYIRTGHDYRASWSLDSHLLNEIVWNLKILKNDNFGCSGFFLDKARAALHKDEEGFDLDEYAKKVNYSYSDEEHTLAKQLRAEEYDRMIEYIALYDYYSNFGIASKELVDDVDAFEKKWSSTRPIKPGTYDELDFDKLRQLEDEYWCKIWKWMMTYGRMLWS